jgi:hypothetical protein
LKVITPRKRNTGQMSVLTAWGVILLVIDIGSSRLLLESTGWLVAHRRSRAWRKLNPVHFHRSSLSGEAPPDYARSSGEQEWGSWGLVLFKKLSLPAVDTDTPDEPH